MILVTGGAGFIGANFKRRWLSIHNEAVVNVDALKNARSTARIESNKNQVTLVENRPGHDLRYSIDFSKATNALGWVPSVSFKQGLASTVKWYLDNENWLIDNRDSTERQGLSS